MNLRKLNRSSFFAGPGGGFSLIEVMVALIVAGVLMVMVSRILGQTIINDEALLKNIGVTRELATLRRLLHRDIQSINDPKSIDIKGNLIEFDSTHNLLSDHPLLVKVRWRLEKSKLSRTEQQGDVSYKSEMVILQEVAGWELSLYDSANQEWTRLADWGTKRKFKPVMAGIMIVLTLNDGRKVEIVERLAEKKEQ